MLQKDILPITIFEDNITTIDFDLLLNDIRAESLLPGNEGASLWEGGVKGSFSRNSKLLEVSGINDLLRLTRTVTKYRMSMKIYSKNG